MAALSGVPSERGSTLAGKYAEIGARALAAKHFGPDVLLPENLSREIVNVICVDGNAAGTTEDGQSFDTAYTTIAEAEAAAEDDDYVFVRNNDGDNQVYDENVAVAGVTIDHNIFLVGETILPSPPTSIMAGPLTYSLPVVRNSNAGATYTIVIASTAVAISGFRLEGSTNGNSPTVINIEDDSRLTLLHSKVFLGSTSGIDVGQSSVLSASGVYLYGGDPCIRCVGAGPAAYVEVVDSVIDGADLATRDHLETSTAYFRNVTYQNHAGIEIEQVNDDNIIFDRCRFLDMYNDNIPIISIEASAHWTCIDCSCSGSTVETTMTAAAGTAELTIYVDTNTTNDDLAPLNARGFTITADISAIIANDTGRFRLALQAYINGNWRLIAEDIVAVEDGAPVHPSITVPHAQTDYIQGAGGYRVIYQMRDTAVGGNRTVYLRVNM